ncbi:O-antigen ligase family protein [Desulfosudis oleivorans]|uniref:O-antigen ligase family protein n=1 Tax=Desulfosudis oleivorans TaxID=181663 RepID=UPI00129479D3|nr:O-antigen ligase family protein [Desulfosudis oleivorans]
MEFTGGASASIHSGIIRVPVILLIAFFYVRKIKSDKLTCSIVFFLLYLLILVLFSSNIFRSLSTYTKFAISLSMIPIAFYNIDTQAGLKRLHISLLIGAGILQINYVLAQMFHFGEKAYSEDGFYLGATGVTMTYIFCYAIAVAPLTYALLKKDRSKLIATVMYGFAAIVTLITFRRGSILAMMVSFLILLYLSSSKYKKTLISLLIFIGIGFWGVYHWQEQRLQNLFEQRIVYSIEREFDEKAFGRVNETKEVWYEFFNKSLSHSLFGSELFNSVEYFNYWKQTGRTIHIDYNNILHGSGLIGLILFILIFWQMIKKFKLYETTLEHPILFPQLKMVFWATVATNLVLSLSTQLWYVTSYSIFGLLIGSTLRAAKSNIAIQNNKY